MVGCRIKLKNTHNLERFGSLSVTPYTLFDVFLRCCYNSRACVRDRESVVSMCLMGLCCERWRSLPFVVQGQHITHDV
jgi:hypothetical protein